MSEGHSKRPDIGKMIDEELTGSEPLRPEDYKAAKNPKKNPNLTAEKITPEARWAIDEAQRKLDEVFRDDDMKKAA